MIGKSLNERHRLGPLPAAEAIATMRRALASHAKPLVEIRAQDARMVALLILDADKRAVRLCRSMGLALEPGATTIFGLLGSDVVRFVTDLSNDQRTWLATPCGPRETKVLLVAGGLGFVSVTTSDGKVVIDAMPSVIPSSA